METSRLEAFSDGVFAIAITLLILEVRPTYLAATLVALWSVPLSLAVNAALAFFYILPHREPG